LYGKVTNYDVVCGQLTSTADYVTDCQKWFSTPKIRWLHGHSTL